MTQYYLQFSQMDPAMAAAMMNGIMQAPINFMPGAPNSPANPRFKTSLCKHFEETGKCNVGAKCHFAHGQVELRGKDDVSIS